LEPKFHNEAEVSHPGRVPKAVAQIESLLQLARHRIKATTFLDALALDMVLHFT